MAESLYDEALDKPELETQEEPLDAETYTLLSRGHLSDSITIGSQEVRLRTLKIGEELEAAVVADKWRETGEAGRALATALVAAAIESVDGSPLINGLGPQDESIEAKFDYVRNNWYWINVRSVYAKYDDMLRIVLSKYDDLSKD
jgi:hypothetical protein